MKRIVFVLFVFAMVTVIAHAAGNTIVGVVTKVEPGTIEVKTDAGATTSVTVNTKTVYMRWILRKPWAQDPRADADFVKVGKRVHIEVDNGNPPTARTVWVVVGRVGFE